MEDLVKSIPIELTELLNTFNQELEEIRKEISLEYQKTQVRHNNSTRAGIKIRYKLRNTSFYFEIEYLFKDDVLSWKYCPFSKYATKERQRQKTQVAPMIFNELSLDLRKWKVYLTEVKELDNPLDYFQIDNFIQFYADEIIEIIPISDEDSKKPLDSKSQDAAVQAIENQLAFINEELKELGEGEDEKKDDLAIAQKILFKMEGEIPRMTVSEVKDNFAVSLAVIRKWCGEKFLAFLKLDKINGYDLSRMLGSFVGGVFGIPKIDQ